MSWIHFSKLNAAGNDFVLIDNRAFLYSPSWAELARAACHRVHGIGADGLLVLHSMPEGGVELTYFNADGSTGAMCGNGGRAVIHYLAELQGVAQSISFQSVGHTYRGTIDESNIILEMCDPSDVTFDVSIEADAVRLEVDVIDTGAPHAVAFVDNMPEEFRKGGVEGLNVTELGRSVRYNPHFLPSGVNFDACEVISVHELRMRTYERGVERETLACGTGAVACSVIAYRRGMVMPPVNVMTRGGSILEVDFVLRDARVTDVKLSGPAFVEFTGLLKFSEERAVFQWTRDR